MTNYKSRLEQLYPDGKRGGQCGTFAHWLACFPPVGDLLVDKIKTLDKYGNRGPFPTDYIQAGDVIITIEDRNNGHVAFVNSRAGLDLVLTESNYHKDGLIHHNRLMRATNPNIFGIFRGVRLFTLK